MASTTKIPKEPLLLKADELWDTYADRRRADALLEEIFVNGKFTGKLWEALGIDTQTAGGRTLIINFIRTMVLDRTTMLSMTPDPKFTVPFTVNPDIALTEQDVLINLHQTLWQHWKIKKTLKEAAFNMALKNRTLWLLFPDFETKKPMLYSLDPSMFYAEPDYNGDYKEVFLMKEEFGRKILAQYPFAREQNGVTEDRDIYKVVEWWDKDRRRVWINNTRAPQGNIDHNLGFIPMKYTQDIHLPGTIDNMGSAFHNIAMAENFTDTLMLISHEMRKRINSVAWVKGSVDPENHRAALRGEEMLDLQEDGQFGFAQPIDSQVGGQAHLGTLEGLFRVATNWPQQRSGVIDSAIFTGKGINASLTGVNDDILNTRETMADDLEWLDTAAIHMMRKMWGKDEHNLLAFDANNVVGSIKVIPELDIPADFRHELVTFALAHDVQGKAVLLMQLFGQKLLDRRSVLEQLPGMNPNEVLQRLEEDMTREVEWQFAVQKKAVEQENEISAPAQVEGEAQALEQGAIPQGAPFGGNVPTP